MAVTVRPRFVAREPELATLQSSLGRARENTPRVVLVEGDAGIGKSTLVRVFIEEAGADQVVLRASGDEREGAVAYGAVGQLVDRMAASALRDSPGLREGPAPVADPLVIGTELAAALGAVARARSMIVILEDLHWFDVASYEALLIAARRLRAARTLIVATCRPAELAHFGGRWERFANTDERCTRVRLGGLRSDAVRTLARNIREVDVPRAVADRIVDHTAGNPLYTTALVEELPDRALLEPGPSLPAPRSFAGVITSRVAALPAPARSLVVAAGILGRTCPLMTAARLGRLVDPVEPLEQAHGVRLLEEVPGSGGREVMFPHPLIRAAVYDEIGPANRRKLHRDAAELTSGLTALAHRVAATVGPDESLASDLEAAATEREERGEMLPAAELWRQAYELSGDSSTSERRVVRAAMCSVRGGDLAGATLLRDAVEQAGATSPQQLTLAQLSFAKGEALECERHLNRAWELRDNATMAAALAAAALLVEVHVHMGRLRDADLQLSSALQDCPRDAPQYTALLAKLAITFTAAGRVEEGRAVTRDPVFPPSAATCAPEQLHGLFERGLARLWTEQLDDARVEFTDIVRRAHESFGYRYDYIDAMALLGISEFRLGRWDDAITHGEEAVALAHEAEERWIYPYVHSAAAMPLLFRGKWKEAEAHVAAAREGATQTFPLGALYAVAAETTLALCRGDAERVINLLSDHGRSKLIATFGPAVFPFAPLLVDAFLNSGNTDEADALLRGVEDGDDAKALPSLALDCARLRGKLESLRGDTEAASSAFAAGSERASSVTVPMSVALFHYEYGRYLRGRGQFRAATSELTRAHSIFTQLGATPLIDAVIQELRSRGMPTSTSPRDEPTRLSDKEMRVARLIAAGRTNREIGSELFLTVKAVEYHLARIYAKLGISSRSALAAWMGQHDASS